MSDQAPQTTQGEYELRDWDAYFVWNTVHLLRSLKVMNTLTPTQKRMVEEHAKLRAASVREDTQALLSKQREQAQRELLEDLMDCGEIHHSVYDYRVERATLTRKGETQNATQTHNHQTKKL